MGIERTETIGITLGDPSGIGPELVAAALASSDDAVRRRLVTALCLLPKAWRMPDVSKRIWLAFGILERTGKPSAVRSLS